MSDLPRDQAELLAQLARDVPDLTPDEFRRRLIEACGGDEAAAERMAEVMATPMGGGDERATEEPPLWAHTGATAAKHLILEAYLDRWFAIMGQSQPELVVIDGFAGPGRYRGGEFGSPVLMVRSFLRQSQTPRFRARVTFVFIERDPERFAHLRKTIQPLQERADVGFLLYNAAYADVMDELIEDLDGRGSGLAPTFALIDPFGYGGNRFDLTARILSFPKCEVLLYVPLVHVARFIASPGRPEAAIDALFDGADWRAVADDALSWPERQAALHDLFQERLQQDCRFVRSFEIRGAQRNTGYHLFFGTGHVRGLEKMKEAMWKADPTTGAVFSDTTNRGYEPLFHLQPNLADLQRQLVDHFGDRPFTVAEAEEFTVTDTGFLVSHLRPGALAPAEAAGSLVVALAGRKRRKGTFPKDAILRFVER